MINSNLRIKTLSAALLPILLLTACGSAELYLGPKQQVSEHIEEKVKISGRYALNIVNPSGNLNIYMSSDEKLTFEIVKRNRGNISKEKLKAGIDEITYCLTELSGEIKLEMIFPENADPINTFADITVHMPKELTRLDLIFGTGTIKLHGDLYADLRARIEAANLSVDKLVGVADIEATMGNVSISGGFLSGGSVIRTGMGNISVKAEFETAAGYVLETGLGNIRVAAPGECTLAFEIIGDIKVNDFQASVPSADIRLRSDMGEISIIKY